MTPYRVRLAQLVRSRRTRLCIGLDPSPDALELVGGMTSTRAGRARAIERFGALVIDAAGTHAVAIKPQLAWYEMAGADGIAALAATVDRARDAGLLVVIDAKRGDIPHSAAAYADAWLGEDAGSGVRGDALTVNASPGVDALQAMADVAHARACELYALVLTSNPGAAELQAVPTGTDGAPWWTHVARAVEATGVGAVVGATRPDVLPALRAALPTAPLLVPGVGAQGGTASDVIGLDAPDAPVLIPVSRSLLPAASADTAALRHAITATAREVAVATWGPVETTVASGTIAP